MTALQATIDTTVSTTDQPRRDASDALQSRRRPGSR